MLAHFLGANWALEVRIGMNVSFVVVQRLLVWAELAALIALELPRLCVCCPLVLEQISSRVELLLALVTLVQLL